ncbi:MAG: S8 family serine peptidase, partial [Planctomycetota bacterium]|nr:S8 family serine peptidase [Planctomycetota bacterium]
MTTSFSRAATLACAAAACLPAQSPTQDAASSLMLRYGSFDPTITQPEVPLLLRSTSSQRLQVVQFVGAPTQAGRDMIAALGGEIVSYLPQDSYVVRIGRSGAAGLRRAPSVRWVGAYHPAYRLDPALIDGGALQQQTPRKFDVVVANKRTDKPALARGVQALGGVVEDLQEGGLLITVALTGPQLAQVAALDQVLWINAWSAPEEDMDNARIQGGGNYIQSQAGYTGAGVNAHIYEGVEASHPDFTGSVTNVRSSGNAQSHGHCTAGIVFGNGSSNPAVRGMAPDAGKFYTNYGSVQGSRYQVVDDLVNIHNVSHTTASWGGSRTFFYTATSASADDIVFDHDIVWTQSQSNAGNQDSRPEAWAKNVFSIGGVDHNNNSNPADDSWQAGNASTGPASDGRIKPTLCAYYDSIGTSDRTGGSGYSNNSWYSNFGGTSGATPMVAGHNVIAIQMFTDEVSPGFGPFGNQLRVPGGTSHQNRPHFPTLKALQVVSAAQYSFTGSSSDNRREHQGWGFPDLRKLWDMRAKTYIIDETDVLQQGQVRSHPIVVGPFEPAFKACLNWSEPAANPSAAQHLVNNLSLRVTSPTGVVYWGNRNLENGVWSAAGGAEDTVNSLESVFVPNPVAGTWNVEVIASAIVQDNHVETPAVDADYGLVVTGGTGSTATFASFAPFGAGCSSSVAIPAPPCQQWNPAGGPLANQTSASQLVMRAGISGTEQIEGFEVYTSSTTGGAVTVPAWIFSGNTPSAAPVATTTITIGGALGFYQATFASPVTVSGSCFIGIDTTGLDVYVPEVQLGSFNVAYTRASSSSPWALQVLRPSYVINCTPDYQVPQIGNTGRPVLGSSFDVELANALPSSLVVLVQGLSDQTYAGGLLPATLPGTAGCDLLVSPDATDTAFTDAAGAGSRTITIPSSAALEGLGVFYQWVVL